jgi:hypothetical protein
MLISEALEGKYYYSLSRHQDGIIQTADRRDNVWTTDNVFAYACRIRPQWNGQGYPKPDFYSTIYVRVDGE